MSSSGSGPRLSSARSYITYGASFDSFGKAFIAVLSGILVMVGTGIIAFQEATVNMFVMFLDAFGIGGADWIRALTSAPAKFVGGSFIGAADAMQNGVWQQLGPFLPWVAAIVAIGVVMLLTWYADRRDSDVIGTGIDLPFVGLDEDGDSTDE